MGKLSYEGLIERIAVLQERFRTLTCNTPFFSLESKRLTVFLKENLDTKYEFDFSVLPQKILKRFCDFLNQVNPNGGNYKICNIHFNTDKKDNDITITVKSNNKYQGIYVSITDN